MKEFPPDTVQLATRIPKPLHIRTRVAALDHGVTMADWVSSALVDHLARCKREKRSGKGTRTAAGGPASAA